MQPRHRQGRARAAEGLRHRPRSLLETRQFPGVPRPRIGSRHPARGESSLEQAQTGLALRQRRERRRGCSFPIRADHLPSRLEPMRRVGRKYRHAERPRRLPALHKLRHRRALSQALGPWPNGASYAGRSKMPARHGHGDRQGFLEVLQRGGQVRPRRRQAVRVSGRRLDREQVRKGARGHSEKSRPVSQRGGRSRRDQPQSPQSDPPADPVRGRLRGRATNGQSLHGVSARQRDVWSGPGLPGILRYAAL